MAKALTCLQMAIRSQALINLADRKAKARICGGRALPTQATSWMATRMGVAFGNGIIKGRIVIGMKASLRMI
jgi:hypothetical protein